jgi:hypothetical protein
MFIRPLLATRITFESLFGSYSSLFTHKPVCFVHLISCPEIHLFSVREPLDKLHHSRFDEWEIVLYVMWLSFLMEGQKPCLIFFHRADNPCRS